MEFTTMEKLQGKVSTFGAVVQYGDCVFFTDAHWNGGFTATVYSFEESPEEGESECECLLCPMCKADSTFLDNGSALKWCFDQVK